MKQNAEASNLAQNHKYLNRDKHLLTVDPEPRRRYGGNRRIKTYFPPQITPEFAQIFETLRRRLTCKAREVNCNNNSIDSSK